MFKNTIKWSPSEYSLPMTDETKGDGLSGVTRIVLLVVTSCFVLLFFTTGSILCLLGSKIVAAGTENETGTTSLILGLGLIALGLFLVTFLINHFLLRKRIVITKDTVSFLRRDIRGRSQWTEPLANYRGVGLQRISSYRQMHTHWSVDLIHDDPSRTISLYWPKLLDSGHLQSSEGKLIVHRFASLLGVNIVNSL